MNKLATYTTVLVLAAMLAGCAGLNGDSKAEGRQRWTNTRAEISFARASEQYGNGDLSSAFLSTRQTLEFNPEFYEAHVLLCKILIAKRSYNDALEELGALSKDHGDDPQLSYMTGAVYEGLGSYDRALDYYRRAGELNPDQPAYLVSQVDCLTVLKRLDEALTLVETRLIPASESARAYEMAGDLSMSLNKSEKAIEYYRRAVTYSPANLDLQHSLAGAYYAVGRYAEAGDILERLVTRQPYIKSAWTYAMLGDCRMAMNKPEKAADAYSRAADLDDNSVAMLVNLSKASLACEDYPRAVLAARRALRQDGDNLSASMVLAYSLMRQGRSDQAVDELIRIEGAYQDDATLLCLIGKAYEASGQVQLARQYYKRALDIDAGNQLASSLLAGAGR